MKQESPQELVNHILMHGISHAALSSALGVSRSYISYIRSGKRKKISVLAQRKLEEILYDREQIKDLKSKTQRIYPIKTYTQLISSKEV